jgi:carboxymethylenebutenolidase
MKRLILLSTLLSTVVLWTGCQSTTDESYTDQMAEEHAHETPEASGMVAEPAVPVDTVRVPYGAADQSVRGYMAVPFATSAAAADSALPAVILIHEWWGLNGNIEAMTRRLAGEGYRVLAVDMYGGQVAETSEQAQQIMGQVMQNPGAATDNLRAAYDYLVNEHDAPAVAIMGWCFGGAQALRGALALPNEIDAAVIYYGQLVTDPAQLRTLNMPVLGFFGGADQGIPVSSVEAFDSTLQALGKDVEVHVYEGAGHAFANPSGQSYVEEAASDSWEKTTAFLREHLKGNAGV